MPNVSDEAICSRIKQIRVELTGPRGKAAFARELGISPTTYQSYEVERVPPADVLVRVADMAEVDLRWLLTGHSAGTPPVQADHPVLQRAARLLAHCPRAAAPLSAFLDLLTQSMAFPAKPPATGRDTPETPAPGARPMPDPPQAEDPTAPDQAREDWIPILGRSAAGVAQFWSGESQADGVTDLRTLVDRYAAGRPQRTCAAHVQQDSAEPARRVQLITLTSPHDSAPAEFIAGSTLLERHADAFAARIDGQSMSPDIQHGDLVVLSPTAPATDGAAAVVQLKGQIGVTCKLFRRQGANIHLVPINEQFEPRTYRADQLDWALRVIARIRPERPAD